MRLVDDDRVVISQQRVGLRLGQQDAVGHQLHAGAGRQPVVEAHLVADHIAERCLQFIRDALGNRRGRNAARLRMADELAALPRRRVAAPAPHRQRDLRQLRGFARTRFAADDDHLMRVQRRHDLVLARADRQVGRKVQQLGLVGCYNFRTALARRTCAAGRFGLRNGALFSHGVRDYPSARPRRKPARRS